MARLSREFYLRDTVEAARELLGKYLVRRLDGELLVGRILETEAYVGRCDKACHAYGRPKTARTSTLYLEGGHAYIYLIYGMYHCLNVVTEAAEEPAAVLIRAVEALSGTEGIRRRRYGSRPMNAYRRKNFLNGPGKVCQGFGLTRADNGLDLTASEFLYLCDAPEDAGLTGIPSPPAEEVLCVGPRVGIDYAEEARDFPWRFWLETK